MGTGLDLEIGRVYNGLSESVGCWVLGAGWSMGTGQDVRLRVHGDESVTFYDKTGSELAFSRRADGSYESPPGLHATLRRLSSTAYELTYHESGERLSFASSGPDSWGRLTAHRDRYANTIGFAYRSTGALSSITDTQGRVIAVSLDASGWITTLTDPTGRAVGYAYDAAGRLGTYTDAAGGQTRYGYDADGRLASIATPAGRVTRLTYDAQGRVATVVRTTDAGNTSGPTTRFAYGSGSPCASGDARTVVSDPLAGAAAGHTTTYCSDALDRVTKAVDAAANPTSLTYGPTGDLTSVRRPAGGVTNFSFDPVTRNLVCVQRGATAVQSCQSAGGGLKTTFAYAGTDALTRHFPTRVTNPRGRSVAVCYNGATPACGTSSGPAGSVQSVRNDLASQNVRRFSYDARGNPTAVTDARGSVTAYAYDAQGNLTRVNPPAGAGLGSRSVSPDALSRPGSVTDGKGQVSSYSYDAMDRVTALTYPGGIAFGYGYDRDGNRTSSTDPSSTSAFEFDRLGRLVREELPGGFNAYGYDAASNLTSLSDAGGTTAYAYDARNLLGSVSEPGAGGATTFAYSPDGLRTRIAYPSGVSVNTGYDAPSGRVASVVNRGPGGGVLRSFVYDYRDPAGKDTELVQRVTDERANRTTNTYDAAGRLVEAVTAGGPDSSLFAYSLDGEGNRLRHTFEQGATTNSASTGASTDTYAYDSAGLPCWRAAGSHASVCGSPPAGARGYSHDANGSDLYNTHQRFAYNAAGQATSVQNAGRFTAALGFRGPGQDELVKDGAQNLQHNALGLGARTNTAARGDSGTIGIQSSCGGDTAAAEQTAASATYHYARTVDGTVLSQRGPAGRRNYLCDAQGSVVGLTDPEGALRTRYSYDPYGHPPNLDELGDPNPFGWQGAYTAGVSDDGIVCGGPNLIGDAFYDAEDGRITQMTSAALVQPRIDLPDFGEVTDALEEGVADVGGYLGNIDGKDIGSATLGTYEIVDGFSMVVGGAFLSGTCFVGVSGAPVVGQVAGYPACAALAVGPLAAGGLSVRNGVKQFGKIDLTE